MCKCNWSTRIGSVQRWLCYIEICCGSGCTWFILLIGNAGGACLGGELAYCAGLAHMLLGTALFGPSLFPSNWKDYICLDLSSICYELGKGIATGDWGTAAGCTGTAVGTCRILVFSCLKFLSFYLYCAQDFLLQYLLGICQLVLCYQHQFLPVFWDIEFA